MADVIAGARSKGPIDIERVRGAGSEGMHVQFLDAGRIVGAEHAESALWHARRAFVEGRNTSGAIEVEAMLYAAGERQISKAIAAVGLRPETREICIMAMDADEGEIAGILERFALERDDGVLSASRDKLLALGFSDKEMDAVGEGRAFDLALERVALLDTKK